jgi:hypothetical protein
MSIAVRRLALSMCVGLCASCDSPTDLSDSPEVATKASVRFQATSKPGEHYPFEVVLDIELENTSDSNRHVTWGGCGIQAHFYRNGSRVDTSPPPPTACDDILHMVGLAPQEKIVFSETIVPDTRRLSPGRYQIIMVFDGAINDTDVELAIDAGDVDLQ